MILDTMERAKAKGEEVAVEDGFTVYEKLCDVRRIYLDVFPKYVLAFHSCFLSLSKLTITKESVPREH